LHGHIRDEMMGSMSIITPQNAATAIGLVNSAFSSVKTALDLAKKTTDLDLKQEVSKAFDNVLELKATVYELAEENRQLSERLKIRETIKRDSRTGNFFKVGEEDTPLCPRCYQGSAQAVVYLQPKSGGEAYCEICRSRFKA